MSQFAHFGNEVYMNIRKISFRILLVTVACILLAGTLSGCNRDVSVVIEEPVYVFVPEFTSISALTGELPNISNIIVVGNSLYFTSTNDMVNDSLFQTTHIFRINLDESEITYLPNYAVTPPTNDAEGGGVLINAIQIDADGNLWVAETERYLAFDFPSNFSMSDAELDEIFEYHIQLEVSQTIRKLDSTGAELLSVDINHLASSSQNRMGIFAFNIDDEGNLFVGSGQTIYILNIEGYILFSIDAEDFIHPNSIIRLSGGTMAHSAWCSRLLTWTLQTIDLENNGWGANIDLPENIHSIFPGNDEYLVLINDGLNLLGIINESNELVPILNWVDSGVEPVGVDNILFLPDDSIMLTTTALEQDSDDRLLSRTELVTLNIMPSDEVADVTVITIASSWAHVISPAVVEFNRTNLSYRIVIQEIGLRFDTLLDDIDRLVLDVIAGRGPDIIHTPSFPFRQWAGRGLFVDLYELIDSDSGLDRSDFLESVLHSFEMNGRLYQLSPDFSVNTILGHPDIVGAGHGWTIDEFRATLDANPQASMPIGQIFSGISFLNAAITSNMEKFVDWENGTVYFDTDYFVELLELAYFLNTKIDLDDPDFYSGFTPYRLITSGEQVAMLHWFTRIQDFSALQELFGGDFVFKGYPVESGSGNIMNTNFGMAILATSDNQQGAWEFLSMVLSESWQRQNIRDTIPTNSTVFNEALADAMQEIHNPGISMFDLHTVARPLTQENTDTIRDVINSITILSGDYVDPLMDVIIMESIVDFLSGAITARDAARIIQNRASTFVAEQS